MTDPYTNQTSFNYDDAGRRTGFDDLGRPIDRRPDQARVDGVFVEILADVLPPPMFASARSAPRRLER